MQCLYCGTDNPAQARFCGQCGRTLVLEEDEQQPIILYAPSSAEQIALGVQSATPALVSTADQLNTPGEEQPTVDGTLTPPSPLLEPSIWPFSGLSPESIQSYPPDIGLMPPPPPPGWPIFQEKGTHDQHPSRTNTQPNFLTWILKPWSRQVLYATIAVVVLIIIALVLTGSDWATGVAHAALVATIVMVLFIGSMIVRLTTGKVAQSSTQKRTQYTSTGLAILVLLLFIGSALSLQPTLHTLQAHTFEQSQQWNQAITQYQSGGDTAPTSINIARVYNEWGEYLTQKPNYAQAIGKFDTVLNHYSRAGSQVSRAQKNEINAYMTAGKLYQQKQEYTDAITQFDTVLTLKFCNVQCQQNGQELDAATYYGLAKSQLIAARYSAAVATFTILQQRFSSSTAYHAAHEDMAKALFGLGQQELNASQCSAAILNYEQLSKAFADTSQGKNAQAALRAPQPVEGRFTKSVPPGTAMAVLTQGLSGSAWKNQIYKVLAGHPLSATIQKNGTFRFKALKQGVYALSWGDIAKNGNILMSTYIVKAHPGAYVYVAHVGPLCAFNFGPIAQAIPNAA
jgi:tetratricopeptide (TPR) repeat protein